MNKQTGLDAREQTEQLLSEVRDEIAGLDNQMLLLRARESAFAQVLAMLPESGTTHDAPRMGNPKIIGQITALLQSGPMSQRDMADELDIDSSLVSRNVRALEEQGVAQRIGFDNRSPVWSLVGAEAPTLDVPLPEVKVEPKPKAARKGTKRKSVKQADKDTVLAYLRKNGGHGFQADIPIKATSQRYYALKALEDEGLVRTTGEMRQSGMGPPTKEWELVEQSVTVAPPYEQPEGAVGVRRAIVIEPGVGVSEGRQVG